MISTTLASLVLASTCAQEQDRVRQHLEGALAQLTTIEPAGLTEQQRAHRANALAVLREYIDRGEFPSNPGVPLTPVFVDARGVRCAMGEVLAKLGGEDIVRHVQQTRNLATVGELRDEPGLVALLTEHGLTPEEAALVQPTYEYCDLERLTAVCGDRDEPVTVAGRARRSVDGGAEVLERFVGNDPPRPLPVFSWPEGTTYFWNASRSGRNFRPRYLVGRGKTYVSPLDRQCGAAPVVSEEVARRLMLEPSEQCSRSLLALDARWALASCGWSFDGSGRPFGAGLCSDSGALRTDMVMSSRDLAQRLLEEKGFGDAGVDLSNYDTWMTEQPGPPILEPITLDAPPALPLPSGGCSQTPGVIGPMALVFFARRQRRRTSEPDGPEPGGSGGPGGGRILTKSGLSSSSRFACGYP